MPLDARFIGPMDRLLYLRSLPNLESLPAAELAALAQCTREQFFRRGSLLLREGEQVSSVYFVVEGRVTTHRAGRLLQVIEPPNGVGFLGSLSADPEGYEARADLDTLTLELSSDEILDAMEDNFTLLQSGIRALAEQIAEIQRKLEVAGQLKRSEPIETPYPERELDLVQRLVLMRRGPYADSSLEPLAELARRAQEIRLEPGEVIWKEGEIARYGIHVVHGVVSCVGEQGTRRFRMGPESVLGFLETHGRRPRPYTVTTESRFVGLRTDSEMLFDVLEDNFELGRAFIGFLATVVTSLLEQLAQSGLEAPGSVKQTSRVSSVASPP